MGPHADVAPARPRWLRVAVMAALGVAGLITAVIILAVALASRPPSWWAGAIDQPAGEGERVERAVATELHRARPDGEPWSVAVTSDQANAWLAQRLPLWLSNRSAASPVDAALVRLRLRQGRVDLGIQRRPGERVLGASAPLSMRDDALWAPASRLTIGRLPLPRAWARSAFPAAESASPRTAAALGAILGRSPLADPAEIVLEDGRRVRLLAVRVEPGRLVLTWATTRAIARAPAD